MRINGNGCAVAAVSRRHEAPGFRGSWQSSPSEVKQATWERLAGKGSQQNGRARVPACMTKGGEVWPWEMGTCCRKLVEAFEAIRLEPALWLLGL